MLLIAITLPPFPAAPLVAAIMTSAALIGARVPVRVWLGFAACPLGFLLPGAAALAVQIDAGGITLAPNGLEAAGALMARSAAGFTCLLFLSLTTPVTDLVAGMRRLGLPVEVTEVALLTYRFIFLLAETAIAMDAAQAARLGHDGFRRRLRSLGVLAANLLPRAMDRVRGLETGLSARGWEGDMRVLSQRTKPSALGVITVLTVVAATAVAGALLS
jgi:cobalt/nickel transport system permease protein